MSEKKVSLILNHMAEKTVPGDEINLWPNLQTRILASETTLKRGPNMNTTEKRYKGLRLAGFVAAVLVIAVALFLATPQGKTWAQTLLHFFTRAESDALPVQSFQLTPVSATTTPDPGDINNAKLTVSDAEQQSGFKVLNPVSSPKEINFVGATYDPAKHSVRLFYKYGEMGGFTLREEPFQQVDDCELCGKVGASASVEEVQVGGAAGEYVQGVWKLTDQGPEWVSDPYLQTLRWQKDGMAFELLFMGPPESISKADMIAIAESVK